MSELAFNVNGEPFEVPANAAGWRVRRLKAKGAPEVVYGRDGLPLVLAIDAGLDELRAEVGTPGRYRLDPVDEAHKPIATATAGYVFVHAAPRNENTSTSSSAITPSNDAVIEAMRMNAEMARTIIDRFPQMIEAAATLLRAADGAGLPSREPRAIDPQHDSDEDDDDAPEIVGGFDLNALVAQLVPVLIGALGKKSIKLPDLASTLDWRKAAAEATADQPALAAPAARQDAASALPSIDPETMAHFIAVQAALKPEEATLAREVAASLSPAELRGWFDELKKLSVPQAVQKIRVLVAGNTEAAS